MRRHRDSPPASAGRDQVDGEAAIRVGTTLGGSAINPGGIESVVRTLRRTRSDVLDHVIAVPSAAAAFDEELTLADPRVRDEVAQLMAELADRAHTAAALAA